MLRVLLEVRHRVVSREELCAAVWPNQAISDATLSSTLRAIRQAVGDSGEAQRYIYTLPGYGYRFIAAVMQDDSTLAGRGVAPARRALETPVALPQLPPEPIAARPAATTATRRQLTVLWCDLRDITALTGPLDPEVLRDVLRAAQALCSQSMARYAGFIAQHLGDGALVYFGYPQAQEDAVHRAVQAALECVQDLAAYQARLGQEQHIRLVIRIGIHTGLVVMDTLGSDSRAVPLAVGNTPIVATRLPELAEPNTVVISDTTARLVGDMFLYQDLGPRALPSMAEPVHVYRVLGASGVPHRLEGQPASTLSPLIGRTVELALLEERWQRITAGQGQVVLVSGEPGIGKSRLVWELRRQVERTEVTSLVFRCSPHHTHSAFIQCLWRCSGSCSGNVMLHPRQSWRH
jgi:class 3 adenylate cyclase